MRRHEEEQHQIAFIAWCRMNARAHPELATIHHIPNGGKRNVIEAAKLKRMGVLAGVLDCFLPSARHGYHGLYIEFKSGTGALEPEQRRFMDRVTEEGYVCIVVRDWVSAKDFVTQYLSSVPPTGIA